MERRLLITGASRGIGAEIAEASARRGWTNLLVSRTGSALRERVARWEQRGAGQGHRWLELDLAAADATSRLLSWLDEAPGPDTLVHNAAAGHFGRFSETALAGHEATIALGVRATVELTHALLPRLAKTGHGHLVYVGSTSGRKPVPFMATYSSTKAFLHQFACALGEELRGGSSRVLLVVPGGVRTEFPERAGLPPAVAARGLPAARVGEDIVRAIEQGREGVLTIGSFRERHGGLLQRLLPPAFWARRMRAFYEPLLPRPPR